MAKAVENASVVVPVLTDKYKNSAPSRQGGYRVRTYQRFGDFLVVVKFKSDKKFLTWQHSILFPTV